jgi:tetratricopeptide (TPR) repeat protein
MIEDSNLAIHRGLIQQAAGEHQEAMPLLLETKTSDIVATFIGALRGATSAIQVNKLHHAADAVRLAIQLQREPAIVAFIEQEPGLRLKDELIATSQDLADRFLSNNLSVSAADILGKLAGLDPNAWNIGRQHAEALARAGEREEALARLAVILTEEQQTGNPLGTIQTMHSILRIVPGNLRMRKRLVDELMKRGMLAEAVVEFRAQAEILERANRRDDAVTQLARGVQIAATLRDWSTVEEFYDHMLRLNPDDIDLRHGAVTTFLESGRVELAVKQLWDIVTISIGRNDSDASVAALHQIIALSPNDTTAFHRLGEILASIGEYAQAERVYRRLAVHLPEDPAVKAKQSALAALARDQSK